MRTIKLHYMPIVYTLVILFSFGLSLGLAHNLIGYFYTHEQEYIEEECWNFDKDNNCKWTEVTRYNICTFKLLEFEEDCNQGEYSLDWWALGIGLFSFVSAMWYIGVFYFINENKKWVRFQWVE